MTIHQDSTSVDFTTGCQKLITMYRCESTEEKPASALENELLLELDTGDLYYWSRSQSAWKKVGYLNS